jgi:hypothetical protein
MTPLHPRHETIQSDIEYQLRPLMSSEAVEILARIMAHLVNRDPAQYITLTDLFRHAFGSEYGYLTRSRDDTDTYHRSGAS